MRVQRMDISRKWEDEIGEQRSDVSTGLHWPIYELSSRKGGLSPFEAAAILGIYPELAKPIQCIINSYRVHFTSVNVFHKPAAHTSGLRTSVFHIKRHFL